MAVRARRHSSTRPIVLTLGGMLSHGTLMLDLSLYAAFARVISWAPPLHYSVGLKNFLYFNRLLTFFASLLLDGHLCVRPFGRHNGDGLWPVVLGGLEIVEIQVQSACGHLQSGAWIFRCPSMLIPWMPPVSYTESKLVVGT